ncbi:hypothetical protein KC19_3G180000 [Ceratodon purpureus]|uniref:Uncharacterized protein n=1 Tax=Ceratodon purpureus TaxID=3225 RepID=A0A8T0IME5_CERPU|nr:hypothetical protein KC19_3G180000 [Ceratodon purpureus]
MPVTVCRSWALAVRLFSHCFTAAVQSTNCAYDYGLGVVYYTRQFLVGYSSMMLV